MAYLNRTIRLAFDGSDEQYPKLGDDIYVVIANPMLMPPSMLRGKVDVELDADGKPKNTDDAFDGSMSITAGIIVDWNVYDPYDFSDDPQKLPLPATPESVGLLPIVILNAIMEITNKAINPK